MRINYHLKFCQQIARNNWDNIMWHEMNSCAPTTSVRITTFPHFITKSFLKITTSLAQLRGRINSMNNYKDLPSIFIRKRVIYVPLLLNIVYICLPLYYSILYNLAVRLLNKNAPLSNRPVGPNNQRDTWKLYTHLDIPIYLA